MDLDQERHNRIAYGVNYREETITREEVYHLVSALHESGFDVGFFPDSVVRSYDPNEGDLMKARVGYSLDRAIRDGELLVSLADPNLILPKNYSFDVN